MNHDAGHDRESAALALLFEAIGFCRDHAADCDPRVIAIVESITSTALAIIHHERPHDARPSLGSDTPVPASNSTSGPQPVIQEPVLGSSIDDAIEAARTGYQLPVVWTPMVQMLLVEGGFEARELLGSHGYLHGASAWTHPSGSFAPIITMNPPPTPVAPSSSPLGSPIMRDGFTTDSVVMPVDPVRQS